MAKFALVMVAGLLSGFCAMAQRSNRPNLEETRLPTQQILSPIGRPIRFPGRPNDFAISHDQSLAAVLNGNGHALVIVDLERGEVRQELNGAAAKTAQDALVNPSLQNPAKVSAGSFAGVVFSPDDHTIYASRADGTIMVAERGSDGTWNEHSFALPRNTIESPGSRFNPYPGGLALSQDGDRMYVCLSRSNTLAVIDVASEAVVAEIPVGNAPAAVVVRGDTAYVSNRGGRVSAEGEFVADSSGTKVVADAASAFATTGTVSVVNLVQQRVVATIQVGLQPVSLMLEGQRLYVANTNSDSISLVDIVTNTVEKTISTSPFIGALPGSSPTGLALYGDDTLIVSLGQSNAIALYHLGRQSHEQPALLGLLPTGWYPSTVSVIQKSRQLVVLSTKGDGTVGPPVIGGPNMGVQGHEPTKVPGEWVYSQIGVLSLVRMPKKGELATLTSQVLRNNRSTAADHTRAGDDRTSDGPTFFPKSLQESSAIKHVVMIIKENKTYDQILGDIENGNGEPRLVQFGRKFTPNHHALAEEFVLLDNFYTAATGSVDAHQWLTQAFVTDYIEKAFGGFTRSYPFNGTDALAIARSGFIWEGALRAGKNVRVYGEYADVEAVGIGRMGPWLERPGAREGGGVTEGGGWMSFFNDYQILAGIKSGSLHAQVRSYSQIPSLDRLLVRDYPAYNLAIPDVYRAEIFLRDFRKDVANGTFPNLVMIALPADHTASTSPGYPVPGAMVADNDLALGRIVEAISKSPFWRETAIFVLEDDAQDGVDHVSGHRTLGFVISPYVKRRSVDSTFLTNLDFTRAIESILGIPPLTQLDMAIPPDSLRHLFGTSAHITPFVARPPLVQLDEMNPSISTLRGLQKEWAMTMASQDWDDEDEADWQLVNRANWYAVRGFDSPYPGDSAVMTPAQVRKNHR